jgi:hypothetical protein
MSSRERRFAQPGSRIARDPRGEASRSGVAYNDGVFTGLVVQGSMTDAERLPYLTVAEGQRHDGVGSIGAAIDRKATATPSPSMTTSPVWTGSRFGIGKDPGWQGCASRRPRSPFEPHRARRRGEAADGSFSRRRERLSVLRNGLEHDPVSGTELEAGRGSEAPARHPGDQPERPRLRARAERRGGGIVSVPPRR